MNSPKRVFITGATGFLGTSLVDRLSRASEFSVAALVRGDCARMPSNVSQVKAPGDDPFSVELPLQGVDAVIHLAARAHVLRDKCVDPLAEFRSVNVDGTLKLARQALAAGVKRFIFVSSIGVNGAQTAGTPFNEEFLPAPHADYALSKLEAEIGLRELLSGTDMELVIVRPPLVYSGGAPGNFKRLLALVASGLPLPFAAVKNQRSMIALENLVDFLKLSVDHPAAANELFLVSDGEEVSTAEIIRYLAQGMGRTALLFPVPSVLMRGAASMAGKQAMYTQLCDSLVIDSSKARALLGWMPTFSPAEALIKAGRDYRSMQSGHS